MARRFQRMRRLWDAYRFPGFHPEANGARRFRCSDSASDPAQSALKKTACGCCGHVQMGWYDRKARRVRDLSSGDTRSPSLIRRSVTPTISMKPLVDIET